MAEENACVCTKKCDCQNPPPDNRKAEGGVFHSSQECPIHNFNPSPNPDCPVHGGLTPLEFSMATS